MARIKPIRNAARAVIIHEGKLLAVKMHNEGHRFYILPGGGQKPGETLPETVRRECLEEVGCEVEVGRLLFIREYIGKNHGFKRHASFHQLEAVFLCYLKDPTCVAPGHEQDRHQTGIAWISLDGLEHVPFYPEAIKQYFLDDGFDCDTLYLGDVN